MQTLERKPVRLARGIVHLGRTEAATAEIPAVMDGTGRCTVCNNCTAFQDDGSGFSRCKCGDRKVDHE